VVKAIGFKENQKCDTCDMMAWFESEGKHYCGKCWESDIKLHAEGTYGYED
jgi:hypothetical protein